MRPKKIRLTAYCLAIGFIVALTPFMAACSSRPTSASAPTLSSIAVAAAPPVNLAVGTTKQFTATVTYSDGSTKDITSKVTWASDTPGTATISSAGLATGVAAGTANISAAISGVTSQPVILTVVGPASTPAPASTKSSVTAPTLFSIAVTAAPPANLAVGATKQFTATGTYSDGSTKDITSKVTWASDALGTATISSAGLATGVAAGTANISAAISAPTAGVIMGVSQSVSLTVVAPTSTTTSH